METGGEERDWVEHLEALKKFGGRMPFSPLYTPERCIRKYERSNSEGNLMAESSKWEKFCDDFKKEFKEAGQNGASEAVATEPDTEQRRERGRGPQGPDDLSGDTET